MKFIACGVCHSDGITRAGMMGCALPRVPGHEIVGKIVEIGPGIGEQRFKVGDIVGGGWHGGHDQTCVSCRKVSLMIPTTFRRHAFWIVHQS